MNLSIDGRCKRLLLVPLLLILDSVGLPLAQAQEKPQASAGAGGRALTVPSGTVLQVRMRKTVSSFGSKRDSPILAEVIAPYIKDGKVLIPMRTALAGHIRDVRKVGLGFSRETAILDFEFSSMVFPGNVSRPILGKVTRVDDARERVDAEGRIHGIRATDTLGATITGLAIAVSAFDPMALLFALSSSLSIFRVPDSTIILPTGAELQYQLTADLTVPEEYPSPYQELITSDTMRESMTNMVEQLPFRTATQDNNDPSDLTSLVYLGSQEAIERAFQAAGWVRSDKLDTQSAYGVMRSVIENQGYRAAPMSTLVLEKKEPVLTYAKTLNTFFSRHHLRIYSSPKEFQGKPVFTSTATYDSGIGFSKAAKTFIHIINENIDEERTKVVNDLILTGCVTGVSYIDRPWVPRDAKNATGDNLLTDGKAAVLELNDCQQPLRADSDVVSLPDVALRQSAFWRPFRTVFLTIRNDLTRGNVVYQAYAGTKLGLSMMRHPAVEAPTKSVRYGGQEFMVVAGSAKTPTPDLPQDPGRKVEKETGKRKPKSYASLLMFSMSGGLNGYGNSRFSTFPFLLTAYNEAGMEIGQDPWPLETSFERGWTLSPKVTLNTWRHFSNEFSYTRTITHFRVAGRDQLLGQVLDLRQKAAIRQFTYNFLIHPMPNGKRFRPYLAVGPAFQLIHLLEAQAESNSLLKLAARDVAIFLTAYNFGSKPPLEGGGIFQFGLNYGGGAIFHATPRLFFRADFRETLSAQPDVWTKSSKTLGEDASTDQVRFSSDPVIKYGRLRTQIVTLGIGISF